VKLGVVVEPVILDIEASGFGRGSYPIEVGIVLPSGNVHSFLIKPLEDWTHWNEDAEKIHGISRELIKAEGLSLIEVATSLNELLEGYPVYSDGWGFDSTWLSLLYYEAGKKQSFKLDALARIISEEQMVLWDQVKFELREEMKLEHHRAGPDALLLQMTWVKTQRQAKQQS
jgi:hypothetical protein